MIVTMTLYRAVQLSRITREDTKCHQPGRPAICLWNRFVCTPRIIISECVLSTQTFSIYRQVQSLRATTSPSATTTYRTATYRSTRSSTATAWTVMAPTANSWYTYVLCFAYNRNRVHFLCLCPGRVARKSRRYTEGAAGCQYEIKICISLSILCI